MVNCYLPAALQARAILRDDAMVLTLVHNMGQQDMAGQQPRDRH